MVHDESRKDQALKVLSQDTKFKGLERRNLPRLSLTSEQFRLSKNNKLFSVNDISENGMSLWVLDREDIGIFSVGQEIEGVLNLRREKFPVSARVRNLSADRVGCEFEKAEAPLKKALADLLNPALMGAELKPIPSTERNSLWYHGPSGTDLLLKRLSDGHFHRFTLFFHGSFIQWDEELGLSTGRATPSEMRSELSGILRLETLYLLPDEKPAPEKLEIAKTIILSSNLPKDLKNRCTRQLER